MNISELVVRATATETAIRLNERPRGYGRTNPTLKTFWLLDKPLHGFETYSVMLC